MLQELKKHGIRKDFPVQLVRLPPRVLTFCETAQCKTLGELVLTLGSRDYEALLFIPGFGVKAAVALDSFFSALRAGDLNALRHYLPIDLKSQAISLHQTLLEIINSTNPKDIKMLEMRLGEGLSLASVGARFGCTKEWVRQKEEPFLDKLAFALNWFSGQHSELWRIWQTEGDLRKALQVRKVAPMYPWVAGAISAVFERSQEGQAIEQSLSTSFLHWADELLSEPSLDASGVSLVGFLKNRTKLECTNRFEQWLKQNLGSALAFPRSGRVKRGAPQLTAAEQEFLYSGQVRKRRWQEMYARLARYHAAYGNPHVPCDWEEDPQLGSWVMVQRQRRARGAMAKEEVSLLNELGFAWKLRERTDWEARLQEFSAFKTVHGHCNVPRIYPANPRLGRYAARLRWLRRAGKLSKKRVATLEKLGFGWGRYLRDEVQIGGITVSRVWYGHFKELLAFKAIHGHCDVPTPGRPKLTSLGRWVLWQRTLKRQGKLPPERERLLQEHGLQWSGR